MSETNQFGLSRDIPSEVEREVRKKCGFGCVICGSAICQYEHLDPPFKEAKEHRVEGIVLLCGACHDRKTRGLLSTETVKQAAKHPKCLHEGFSFGPFDVGNQHPSIIIGTFRTERVPRVICVGQETLLGVEKPETPGGPFRLSANFEHSGQEFFRIEQNQWRTPTSNWDVEIKGQRIIIRRAKRDIILQLKSDPPHTLIVETIDFQYQDFHVRGNEEELRIDGPGITDHRINNFYSHDQECGLMLGPIGIRF
jgi:hypothetical protein